jgi:hypothetical protein
MAASGQGRHGAISPASSSLGKLPWALGAASIAAADSTRSA